MKKLLEKLTNPSPQFRPLPLWSWNDRLTPAFLRWQIREMSQTGLGGYFMHARGGLETEYLSADWMECVKTCIGEGGKNHLASWIYDEVGWPSGFAGGLVTAMGDRYHARGLKIEFPDAAESLVWGENCLGLYSFKPKTQTIKFFGEGAEQPVFDPLMKEETLVLVSHTSSPHYVDVLSPEVTQAFIYHTHEKYDALFGDEWGRGLQGFFTDEPRLAVGKVPWSYILPEKFLQKYGYPLIPSLPLLFLEGQGYAKLRNDFWILVSELFTTSFMGQLYRWCEEHHCQLTGHVMMEESLYSQMTGTAGSMPFYEHMHIPGMDWLRRDRGNPVVPKQVSSVACQLGKKQVLTETYALCGWNISFEEMKWMAEWQFVNGVNLMCQHLQGYSLRGSRKRDYPPSMFFHQPWWGEYSLLNDYLAKLGQLLSMGKSGAKVLLLHPMRSAFIAYDGDNNPLIRHLDKDFSWLSEALSGLHVDYHYGDEGLLAKYGRVEQKKFVVGACEYDVVILPSLLTINRTTLKLLEQWLESGGRVLSVGDFPRFCNGESEGDLELLRSRVSHIKQEREVLYQQLKDLCLPIVSVTDQEGEIAAIYYQQRELTEGQLFFLVNQDKERSYQARVEFFLPGTISRLSLEENQLLPLTNTPTPRGVAVDVTFLPMQSYLFMVEREEGGKSSLLPEAGLHEHILPLGENWLPRGENWLPRGENWQVEAMELNSLTLDMCEYRIGEGNWEGPLPVIKLMDKLLGMKENVAVELKFSFELAIDWRADREFFMALETPWIFQLTFNGQELVLQDQGWWKDSAFKKLDIKARVRKGINTLSLKTIFGQNIKVNEVLFGKNIYESEINKLTLQTELESIYVVGEFGVISKSAYNYGERKALHTHGPFIIVEKPAKVKSGDLTPQGFCFFSGHLLLSQTFRVEHTVNRRIVLGLDRVDAVLIKVFINDQLVKNLPWAPYCLDVTDYLVAGENKLSLQLFSGNRNLLGPHHHIDGELYSVGPGSFTGKWSWTERKSESNPDITPEDRLRNFWKDGYCFVRFGI